MANPDRFAYIFGVTQMPLPLGVLDIRKVVAHLPSDFTLESESVTVSLTLDLDETGTVTVDIGRPTFRQDVSRQPGAEPQCDGV